VTVYARLAIVDGELVPDDDKPIEDFMSAEDAERLSETLTKGQSLLSGKWAAAAI